MPASSPADRVVRFGIFELDLSSGELRKSGTRVKLHDQPFQVLAILLSRPGEVVTREEIRGKLWPDDTFVDYDHGLNNAINRLREALGDSAETPRFIETLPRKGYRFIGQVAGDEYPTEAEYQPAEGTPVAKPVSISDNIEEESKARPRFLVTTLVCCFALALAVIA